MSQPATAPEQVPSRRVGLAAQIRGLDDRFWIVNVMEMFERLAYYGVRSVVAIYMVLPLELAGPQFTHVQKGNIFAAWAAMQSVLPAFTGGFADRYGHKRTIAFAIVLKIMGYVMMAQFKTYGMFFLGCMLLAAGTAVFKPGVQGTLAASLKKSDASVGWGIFYQLVNVGGFLGPVLAGVLRLMDWTFVFYSCAVIVSINFLWLPFYTDPTEEAEADEAQDDGRHARGWASLSQGVSERLAYGWSAVFGLIAAWWYSLLFLGAGEVVDNPPRAWMAFGVTGIALAVAGIVLPRARGAAARWAWLPFTALLGLTLGILIGGAYTTPLAALQAFESGPVAALGTMAFAGLYLAPTAAGLAAVLSWFAARKDAYDEGRDRPFDVLVVSVTGLFQHRVLWFCLVFSGFWLMFNQVFDLLPNVIDDWVDSSGMIAAMGRAFSAPAIPTLLAVVLGLIYGGVCAAGVLLAMRPDRKRIDAVSVPAYVVVSLGLVGALWFPAMLALGVKGAAVAAPVLAVATVAAARSFQVPAKWVAGSGLAVGAVGAFVAVRGTLLAASPDLVEMAAAGTQVNPEWMINLNPGLIVFTMVFFAYLSSFVRPLTSILIGMIVATLGSVIAGTAVVGWVCVAGVLVFSIGEMLSSPKKMEYLATLSRKGQEGLFMGYANIPVAIGWIAGSIFAGNRYEEHGDKVNLARRHLVEVLGMPEQAVEALQKTDVMPTLADRLGTSVADAQHLLFDTYHPEHLWIQIAAIGLVSIVGMLVYDQVLRRIDARAGREAA